MVKVSWWDKMMSWFDKDEEVVVHTAVELQRKTTAEIRTICVRLGIGFKENDSRQALITKVREKQGN